ncbi:hypothetical protein AAHH78_40955, partial [Burkholderia pseudomallei]
MIVSPTTVTTMDLLLIATGLSVIGIGARVAFARRVDPLSGRLHGRLRKRCSFSRSARPALAGMRTTRRVLRG